MVGLAQGVGFSKMRQWKMLSTTMMTGKLGLIDGKNASLVHMVQEGEKECWSSGIFLPMIQIQGSD